MVANNMDKPRNILIRFGERAHLEDLRKSGRVRLRDVNDYAKIENDALRGDRFEGLTDLHQPKDIVSIKIETAGKTIDIRPDQLAGPFLVRRTSVIENVFCTYGLKPENLLNDPLIDPRNYEFADSFIVIIDGAEFAERLGKAAVEKGLDFSASTVSYFDRTYSGEIGVFRKSDEFAFQQEVRFSVSPGSVTAFFLEAGSMIDITTEVMPVADIGKIVSVRTSD